MSLAVIELTDEADQLLREICMALGLGRGESISLALTRLGENLKGCEDLAKRFKDLRTIPDWGKIELELVKIRREAGIEQL